MVNARALELGLRTALALNCAVAPESKFDRKNYSYPDIPKGYQISQYDQPIGTDGWLEFRVEDRTIRWSIIRVHLEEDTGKTVHTTLDGRDVSLVDYNRSGVPLMEIVTTPESRSPEEARELFAALRQILTYLGANDGNLQEGSMRADVNVSLRHRGGPPGTKVEIKNLNSFRAVQRAIDYEIERQTQVLRSGGSIEQETRGWSEESGRTVGQRTKEYAQDYRYFPEPDLPPLLISAEWTSELRSSLPEMPSDRYARFLEQYQLTAQHAAILTRERPLAEYFERAVEAAPAVSPRTVANWITGDYLRLLDETRQAVDGNDLTPGKLAALLSMVETGEISGAAGKQVLEEAFRTGEEPPAAVDRLNLRQITDAGTLEGLVDDAMTERPDLVETYRKGKTGVLNALLRSVIQSSGGRASPQVVRDLLERKLR